MGCFQSVELRRCEWTRAVSPWASLWFLERNWTRSLCWRKCLSCTGRALWLMGDWVETRFRFFDCLGELQVFPK